MTTRRFGVAMIAVLLGSVAGCKGSGAEGKAPALVKVGTPMVLGGISWEVVEASDRGQALPATSDAEVLRTQGHFVQVHFLIVNKGSSETGLTAPDLVDYDPDTGKNSLHFRPHADGWEHLPHGAENLDRSKIPPNVPKDYWTIYDVAAGVSTLHVWFAGAAPQIDLGPLALTPTVAPAVVADAGTGDAGSAPLCSDLDTWAKPLMNDAASLDAVMPTFRDKTGGSSSFDVLKGSAQEMQQETSTRAAGVRSRLAALQSHGAMPEEKSILGDLVGAHYIVAIGFEKYSEAFRMAKFSQAFAAQEVLHGDLAAMTHLDKDLHAKCRKVSGGGAPTAAAASAPPTVFVACKNGLQPVGNRGGACICGLEDPNGYAVPRPRPGCGKASIEATGCRWTCP